MCLEMCDSELAKDAFGCHTGMTMVSSPSDFCLGTVSINALGETELKKKHLSCFQNCRPGCLYESFLKSSTKIKADLSSTKGAALPHSLSNMFMFVAPVIVPVLMVPL
ncbi:hypothetical protein AVEN_83739-1 [Araneus ventricosus]|uniref:PAR1 n=1 Tax=Araneus ventricosus TaxID=182803 RepID=A0A4Y2EU81_ARAVE|nr:hypothetical protein AVEN_83739-1 [Araneus ventricosus]